MLIGSGLVKAKANPRNFIAKMPEIAENKKPITKICGFLNPVSKISFDIISPAPKIAGVERRNEKCTEDSWN